MENSRLVLIAIVLVSLVAAIFAQANVSGSDSMAPPTGDATMANGSSANASAMGDSAPANASADGSGDMAPNVSVKILSPSNGQYLDGKSVEFAFLVESVPNGTFECTLDIDGKKPLGPLPVPSGQPGVIAINDMPQGQFIYHFTCDGVKSSDQVLIVSNQSYDQFVGQMQNGSANGSAAPSLGGNGSSSASADSSSDPLPLVLGGAGVLVLLGAAYYILSKPRPPAQPSG